MLAFVIGLLLTSRPIIWLVFPLICRIIGLKNGLISLLVCIATTAPFWPIPALRFASNSSPKAISVLMIFLSIFISLMTSDKRKLMLSIGLILTLPSFLVSCNSQHLIFSIPFILYSIKEFDCEKSSNYQGN